eukprot:365329-Chlamydomonas_euryale.AAC.2
MPHFWFVRGRECGSSDAGEAAPPGTSAEARVALPGRRARARPARWAHATAALPRRRAPTDSRMPAVAPRRVPPTAGRGASAVRRLRRRRLRLFLPHDARRRGALGAARSVLSIAGSDRRLGGPGMVRLPGALQSLCTAVARVAAARVQG